MSSSASDEVIYEVECSIDPAVIDDFDTWLPGHVREVLACEGFLAAEIQAPQEEGERPLRRCQYRLANRAALEQYFEHDAPRLRADSAGRFGDSVVFTRRVLAPAAIAHPASEPPLICRNCGAEVAGQYCADCGQSREVHVLSLQEVLGDVTHSLLHLDSRAWRTFTSLVLRPGELTREFIAGRHQRYLPPFRLYLVLSVFFFALSALLPEAGLVSVDRGQVVAGQELAGCTFDERLGLPQTLKQALETSCRKLRQGGTEHLGEVFLHTAPKLMFVFLPLIAAIAMLFYWRPRRLYAEHLVLFLHVQAFVFLWLSAYAILGSLRLLAVPLGWLLGVINLALVLYLPWYVFRAMRVTYAEGRLRTAVKFLAIGLLYFALLGIVMAFGLLYSLLSL